MGPLILTKIGCWWQNFAKNITWKRLILVCLDNDNLRYSDGTGSSHQFSVGCSDAPADSNVNAGVVLGFGLVDGSEERSQLWQITNDAETEVEKNIVKQQ